MTATSTSFLYHVELMDGTRLATHVNKHTAMAYLDLKRRAGLSVVLYQESHVGFIRIK